MNFSRTDLLEERPRDDAPRDDGAPRDEREMKVSSGDGGAEGMGVDGLIESNWDQVTESFDDMGLHQQLLRGIYGYGFEKPSGQCFSSDDRCFFPRSNLFPSYSNARHCPLHQGP